MQINPKWIKCKTKKFVKAFKSRKYNSIKKNKLFRNKVNQGGQGFYTKMTKHC